MEKLSERTPAGRTGLTIIAVGLVVVLVGWVGMTPVTAQSSDDTSGVEIYEHETDSGETVHTIALPPEDVDTPTDGVLGVVVIPEQNLVCHAVADRSYEATGAGCTTNESRVEAYLDAAGVARTDDGSYAVA